MPAVKVRREFVAQVFAVNKQIALIGAQREDDDPNNPNAVFTEVHYILSPLEEFWDRGKGMMKWAKEGEEHPNGSDGEKDAGTDVDSSGDESDD